ncbi:MAG: hypothetical protein EOQ50_09340 [Mesorhizobium sp.]|uniref:hypothetical protein n=1 Tax=Mesorhizobium sp. TaxID=1871066 RepID=UPI000FE763F6|nr:hypothetical protein [Mesorhizobium sp.]RWB77111.1 MAG: hypothetical protein EOQ50_09340 [Mesorhizobium sp.]
MNEYEGSTPDKLQAMLDLIARSEPSFENGQVDFGRLKADAVRAAGLMIEFYGDAAKLTRKRSAKAASGRSSPPQPSVKPLLDLFLDVMQKIGQQVVSDRSRDVLGLSDVIVDLAQRLFLAGGILRQIDEPARAERCLADTVCVALAQSQDLAQRHLLRRDPVDFPEARFAFYRLADRQSDPGPVFHIDALHAAFQRRAMREFVGCQAEIV